MITTKRGPVIVLVGAVVATGLIAASAGATGQPTWKHALDTRGAGLDHTYGLDQSGQRALGGVVPDWQSELMARSDALNRRYHLGAYAKRSPSAEPTTPAWFKALVERSEALDRRYGLGNWPRRPTQTGRPAWEQALAAHSDALDRKYRLGKYAGK